jgi:hypothetical protein
MSQFTKSITEQRAHLTKRFDALLRLRNVDAATLDSDAHYAVFKLAQLVATQFPGAEPMFHWTHEQISYHLPPPWETNQDPHWLVECPRLEAPYDEVLAADDAILFVSSSGASLSVRRQFRVDDTIAAVNIEARLPQADEAVLRMIGKIEDIIEPGYSRTTSTC